MVFGLKLFNFLFLLQVRTLRLRIHKAHRIDEARYNITSVQDDQSEINLSSGRIYVDLLHKEEICKNEGIITVEPIISYGIF